MMNFYNSFTFIISFMVLVLFFQMTFERLLQSTGMTVLSMISQMTGAIINIIFDPILIFGLCGFPKLGVAGAAYATVLGQCVAASIGLFLNLRYNKDIHFSLRSIFHPALSIIGKIYFVGVPSILMMSIGSVMTYFMNLILVGFSTTAAAVFGVYFKLQSFFFMPLFGINNATISIIAFNYGARKPERMTKTLKIACTTAFCFMLCGLTAFQLIPEALLSLFNPSQAFMAMGVKALRIISIHFPIAAFSIMLGATQLTVTPKRAYSTARLLTSPPMALLAMT